MTYVLFGAAPATYSVPLLKEEAEALDGFKGLGVVNEGAGAPDEQIIFSFLDGSSTVQDDVNALLAAHVAGPDSEQQRWDRIEQGMAIIVDEIMNTTAYQNNVRGHTLAEVQTWYAGLGAGAKDATVGGLVKWLSELTIIVWHLLPMIDPKDES